MNFSNEARLGGASIVAVTAIGLFALLCVLGQFYKPLPRDQAIAKWTAACIHDHKAYGCFERIVRDTREPEEGKKALLAELGRQADVRAFLETCSLGSKVDCAFHVVDFGVLSWNAFNSHTGTWEDFDKRVEAGSHCKRLSCLSDNVPLPDVNWEAGA